MTLKIVPIEVFPTRVGMDRRMRPPQPHQNCIPHTRGDGPRLPTFYYVRHTYSPHAWGWTEPVHYRFHPRPVFPTRVGMDREHRMEVPDYTRIPHTRGDGPCAGRGLSDVKPYSPHAWGWTVSAFVKLWEDAVFPTRVGMDR